MGRIPFLGLTDQGPVLFLQKPLLLAGGIRGVISVPAARLPTLATLGDG